MILVNCHGYVRNLIVITLCAANFSCDRGNPEEMDGVLSDVLSPSPTPIEEQFSDVSIDYKNNEGEILHFSGESLKNLVTEIRKGAHGPQSELGASPVALGTFTLRKGSMSGRYPFCVIDRDKRLFAIVVPDQNHRGYTRIHLRLGDDKLEKLLSPNSKDSTR